MSTRPVNVEDYLGQHSSAYAMADGSMAGRDAMRAVAAEYSLPQSRTRRLEETLRAAGPSLLFGLRLWASVSLALYVARASEICIGIVCAGIVLAGTDLGGARRRLGTQLAELSAGITAGFSRTLAIARRIRRHAVRPSRVRSPCHRPRSRHRPDPRGIVADSLPFVDIAERG